MHEMNHRCNVGRKLLDANNASYAPKNQSHYDPQLDVLGQTSCTFSQTSPQPVFSMKSNGSCKNYLGLRFFGLLPCALIPILEHRLWLCVGRYIEFESDVSALIDRPLGECCSPRPRHLEPLTRVANLPPLYLRALTCASCESLHASASRSQSSCSTNSESAYGRVR